MNLMKMFETSASMGIKDSSPYRTYDYVHYKCSEELGELSQEIQIEKGLSYKSAGKDGVRGEAVDLAITAMDMFYLTCSHLTPEEAHNLFLETMSNKIDKWIRVSKD